MRPDQMLEGEKQALEKLLKIASGDTEQSRKVADFLLAWWNAGKCGGYDLTTAWGINDEIVEAMTTVFRLASRAHSYPDTLGYSEQFEALVRDWHPELVPDD